MTARLRNAPPTIDRARAQGALLGLAAGDALGTTLEFARCRAPPFPQMAGGPHTEITGGGPFQLEPGQVTDDTQMATCLSASLRHCRGFDPADAARRYLAWESHAFDVGTQTARALAALRDGADPADAGRWVWRAHDPRPAGNGSLMRTAPLGIYFAQEPHVRRSASLADSAITHFDPRCQLACAGFNAAVAVALTGAGTAAEMAEAARNELWGAAGQLRRQEPLESRRVAAALDALEEDLFLAGQPDPKLYGPEVHLHDTAGYVRVAFRLAFWELLHARTFEAGVIDAVNRGGDADTNGSIAGALLGAFHGVAAVPPRWRERVLEALDNRSGPLRDLYHPRVLLRLVEVIDS
jgi:ADP-ribosyl-[dinitrogen reductase] hydrolase